MKTILAVIVILAALSAVFSQNKAIIEGRVTGSNSLPLPLVTVFIENTTDGCMADEQGYFRIRTGRTGNVRLIASLVGYTKEVKELDLTAGGKCTVNFMLEETVVTLKDAVVTASSFSSVKEKGVVMSKIDVLMTPGGAADMYQSLKTLPGLTQVSESAELYVRGGEPIETITIIDGAVMYHPFTFESGYGGLFSNLKTSFIKNMFFSSGGFSAKYGNALSGVVDVETRGIPDSRNVNIGVSMANGGLAADIPLIPGAAGFTLQYDRSFTAPLFWLNGGADKFSDAPWSNNFTGCLSLNYSATGKIKFTSVSANDQQGVNVERAEFNGEFNGSTSSRFYNFQLSDIVFSNLLLKNSFSYNSYSNRWKFGLLDLIREDKNYIYRLDIEKALLSSLGLKTGLEIENRIIDFKGVVPADDYNIRPDGQRTNLASKLKGRRFGIYAELELVKIPGLEGLGITAGCRYDRISSLNLEWINPRLNVSYKAGHGFTFMAATGIFNQLPEPRLFSSEDGNPDLKPMEAFHLIGACDYAINAENSLRLEVYNKKYTSLPLKDAVVNYSNSGYGFARGADFIYKASYDFGLSGWLSYGFIRSRRYWMDFSTETVSSTDITHNFTLILKYSLSAYWQVGANIKYATGRPFTPINSAVYNDAYHYFEPVEGQTNSARFPDYKRLDVRLTHFRTLFTDLRAVFFLEALNILDLKNIFGYKYSSDYSSRQEISSYFGHRMLVLGANLMF